MSDLGRNMEKSIVSFATVPLRRRPHQAPAGAGSHSEGFSRISSGFTSPSFSLAASSAYCFVFT